MRSFAEPYRCGWQQSVQITEMLHDSQSDFQHVQVFDTVPFGRMLVLDDAAQTTERDEYIYHEMLVHVPMMTHPCPRRTLVIGGGDGGALRTMLTYPEIRPTMVEIDGEVVRVCKELMPSLSAGAFTDPRGELIIGDGVAYLRDTKEHFDVIVVDSTDPVGPAVELFGEAFYRDAQRALGDDGIIVTQSGSPLVMLDELRAAVDLMRRVFPIVRTYLCSIPAYPGVLWSFTAASMRLDPAAVDVELIAGRLRAMSVRTGWYTPAVHQAAFALPTFLGDALRMKDTYDPAALPAPISG